MTPLIVFAPFQKVSEEYCILVEEVRQCADSPGGEAIKEAVNHLADPCSELIRASANVQSSPHDVFAKRELADHAKGVSQAVHKILQVLTKFMLNKTGVIAVS